MQQPDTEVVVIAALELMETAGNAILENFILVDALNRYLLSSNDRIRCSALKCLANLGSTLLERVMPKNHLITKQLKDTTRDILLEIKPLTIAYLNDAMGAQQLLTEVLTDDTIHSSLKRIITNSSWQIQHILWNHWFTDIISNQSFNSASQQSKLYEFLEACCTEGSFLFSLLYYLKNLTTIEQHPSLVNRLMTPSSLKLLLETYAQSQTLHSITTNMPTEYYPNLFQWIFNQITFATVLDHQKALVTIYEETCSITLALNPSIIKELLSYGAEITSLVSTKKNSYLSVFTIFHKQPKRFNISLSKPEPLNSTCRFM